MRTVKLENIKNIVKEINTVIADGVNIILEKGEYHIYPSDLTERTFMITNSLPRYQCEEFNIDYTKKIAIVIENKNNVTIDGNGSKLICHGKMIPIYSSESENITVKNITVDYADPTVTEMTVVEMGSGYYICRVHPDSKYRIDNNGKIIWYGENFEFYNADHNFQQYFPDTETTRRHRPSPMSDKTARYEDLGDNLVKLTYEGEDNPYELAVGMGVQQRDGVRDACGLLFDNSKNITLERVNMRFMHGLGIVAQRTEGLTIKNCECAPDAQSGRKVSSFADCCQISNCRGKVTVTDTFFSGAHDDAVNVHGTYLKIVESQDNTVVVRYVQPDTTGFDIFRSGDTVEVCDPEYMLCEDRAVVLKSELINEFDIRLTLDKPADKFKVDFVVENISACPEVYISGCTVKCIPTRGFLVSTRKKVLIENNEFHGLCRAAVLIANDAMMWYETGPVCDVTIRNNRIYGQTQRAIFRIQPENKKFRDDKFVHNNITIEGNYAEGNESVPWLYAKSTDNLVFRNNTGNFVALPNEIENCGKIIVE